MSDAPRVDEGKDKVESDAGHLDWKAREQARDAFDRRLMWSALAVYFIAWALVPAANTYWKEPLALEKLLQLCSVTLVVAAVYVRGHVVAIRKFGHCYLEADRVAIGRALLAAIAGLVVAHPDVLGMLANSGQWYALLTGFFFAWIAGHVLAIAYSALASTLFMPRS